MDKQFSSRLSNLDNAVKSYSSGVNSLKNILKWRMLCAIVTSGWKRYLFFRTVKCVTFETVCDYGRLSKFKANLFKLIVRFVMNEKLAHNSGII